jgi:PEP-CTERM motif
MGTKLFTRAAALVGPLLVGTALAAPLQLGPGGEGGVPVYDGRMPTTTTLLAATCGYFSGASCSVEPNLESLQSTGESILLSSGGFLEAAGTTALNPFPHGSSDLAIAFIFGGSQSTSIFSATVSSLGGYSTYVEGCGPIFGTEFEGCATTKTGNAGTATRSGGTGDSITFTNIPANPILGLPATDGYVIYTNAPASALVDPNNFTFNIDGQTYAFPGLGLKAPTTGAPEPASLGLLGLGLLGMLAQRARRRR